MTFKFDALFWPVMFVVLVCCAGWQTYQNRRLQTPEPADSESHAAFRESMEKIRTYEFAQIGKVLTWPPTMKVFGPQAPNRAPGGYKLVLALSELSCDVCRDEETQFALGLARQHGVDVTIVVRAAQARYVRSYMRLNGIELSVYHDQAGEFFQQHQLGEGPLLMLVNPQQEVIAAHWPLPGDPDLCRPFHQMCTTFFQSGP